MEQEKLLYELRPPRIHHHHPLSPVSEMHHRKYLRCFIGCVTFFSVLLMLYLPVYHQARSRENEAHSGAKGAASSNKNQLNVTRKDTRHIQRHHLLRNTASLKQQVAIQGWSHNTSRDLRLYVLPDNITAIIPQPEICSSPKLFLLVVVCSAVANFKERAAIRDTWASITSVANSSNSVRVAFLLGDPDNSTLQELVEEESMQFADIIQEGFIDSYNNLTLKTVMMLKWVTTHCHSVHYVMKTDDDMFVNIENLVKLLRTRTMGNLLVGTLICGARPISDTQNKWYAPKYMYSGRVYPNYLSGTGYVMSRNVVARLYKTALETPLFHLEDVYLTGMCAHVAGIRPRHHPAFSYTRRRLDPCLFKDKSVITSHHVNGSELRKVWSLMHSPQLDCSGFTATTTVTAQKTAGKNGKQRVAGLKRANKCY